MSKYFLGIDTSAYTTSMAVVDDNGSILSDIRKVLEVKKGKRGLRQQEAIFQHINNMPSMIDQLTKEIDLSKIVTVSASIKPRNIKDSYMPVFNVSKGQAYILAKTLGVEYKEFTHQDGHIGAAFNKVKTPKEFLALHISGGTTELLYVKDNKKNYEIDIVGGSKDISAGQLIDRIGVKLGMAFPCGKEMETYLENGEILKMKKPISTSGMEINFSGIETFLYRSMDGENKEDIIKTTFYCVGYSLVSILENAIKRFNVKDVVIIGGVASNKYIRNIIHYNIGKDKAVNVIYPNIKYCTDNAVGIAYLGSVKRGI